MKSKIDIIRLIKGYNYFAHIILPILHQNKTSVTKIKKYGTKSMFLWDIKKLILWKPIKLLKYFCLWNIPLQLSYTSSFHCFQLHPMAYNFNKRGYCPKREWPKEKSLHYWTLGNSIHSNFSSLPMLLWISKKFLANPKSVEEILH